MTPYEQFRAWPFLRQLIIAAALFVALCAILVTLYVYFFHRPYRALFTNMRPADAATVVGELDKKKTPYRLKDGGATILVPEALVDQTRLNIMSEDLPIKGMVGFELFNKSDMGLTEFAQKINYQRALQGELARTIMTIDAVDSARVHLSLPEPTIFRDDRRAPKASVSVITRPGKLLTPGAVSGIRRLVAAAVPDLELANVVVLDERGDILGGDVPVSPIKLSPELQQRHAIEQYYTGLIRGALAKTYPNTDAAVTVPEPVVSPEGEPSALANWTPSTRHFRLSVTIGDDAPLTPRDQGNLRQLVEGVIGSNTPSGAALGDEIMISPVSALPQTADDVSPAGQPAPSSQADVPPPPLQTEKPVLATPAVQLGSASAFWVAALIALLVPLGFIAGLIARRPRRPARPLTEQERNAYAERFRTLLAKGGVNAESTR